MTASSNQAISRLLADYCRRLYERKMIGGTEGNLSVRLKKDQILITPGGRNKGFLKPSDMIVISASGKAIESPDQPSSEYRLHLAIYSRRPEIHAVCHAHPIYATAFAVAGLPLDKLVLPEIINSLGIIPLAAYGTPGTEEISLKIIPLIAKYEAILLANHGVITLGKDLEEAYNRMEMVERYAEVMFAATLIGKPKTIPLPLAEKLPGIWLIRSQKSAP